MPARELTFTTKNILSAWEAAGAIPVNSRRVLKSETRKNSKGVSLPMPSQPSISCGVPKTPRAVSRDTRSAIGLISRNTPSKNKLKALLSGLWEGFQQAIADRVLEEESHQQYRELVGSVRYGASGALKPAAPASIPRPAPVNGPGRGVLFFNPCPCPVQAPAAFNAPNSPPSMNFLRPGPRFFVYSPLEHCSFDT